MTSPPSGRPIPIPSTPVPSSRYRKPKAAPSITDTPASSDASSEVTAPLQGDFFSSSGVLGFRRRKVEILSQADFIEKHASAEMLAKTRVGDGGSVMLGMYKNAKVMF